MCQPKIITYSHRHRFISLLLISFFVYSFALACAGGEQGSSTAITPSPSGQPQLPNREPIPPLPEPFPGGPITPPVTVPSVHVSVTWENQFNVLPQDSNGWSIVTPSFDSKIMYVSSSSGNDATAVVYSINDPAIGSDPMLPVGNVQAFQSIDQALANTRNGFPDWVLLKRGDEWVRTSSIEPKSGRSTQERTVIGYYGSDPSRPYIKTGTANGIRFWENDRFIVVLGLNFYAHGRDPDGSEFAGWGNVGEPRGFSSYTFDPVNPNQSILIEDCIFNYYSNNTVQGTEVTRDFIVRRSHITNNYSDQAHSGGMYTYHSSVLLEENFLDHNGWYQQSFIALNNKEQGQATFFNHNTYFTDTHDTIFRGNIFARASSIGNKFTSNPSGGQDEIKAWNILLDNNLYIEGEIGISLGGNTDNNNGYRWQNIHVVNNVVYEIGRAQPTNRTLGWGIEVMDWNGGRVFNNSIVHTGNPVVSNVFGLNLKGHLKDVDVHENQFFNIQTNGSVMSISGSNFENVNIFENEIQVPGTTSRIIDLSQSQSELSFFDNAYFSNQNQNSWFRIGSNSHDFTTWSNQTGDTASQSVPINYFEPNRTVETYNAALGGNADLADFLYEVRQQSKQNWRPAYTADSVNNYIRGGF